MEQRRSRRLEHAGNAERDQSCVDTDDLAIIFPDPLRHAVCKTFQHDQLSQVFRRDGNVGDLPCKFRSIADGDARVGGRQSRRIVDPVPDHDDLVSLCFLPLHKRNATKEITLRIDLENSIKAQQSAGYAK